jgi:hypothetical protein
LRFKFCANNRPNAARHVTVINDEIPSAQPLRLRYTYPLAIITIPVAADITGSRKDVKENRFTLRTH